ncbi:hypothetical protein K8I28_10675 [bacterium]|nr:hypothetical protein [bacterium]
MTTNKNLSIKKILGYSKTRILLVTLLFGFVYTQLTLYSGNQNSYFLQGLADSGYGFLSNDWLANTTDPFPLFSKLVQFTAQFTFEKLFYVQYFFLTGIYLFSLLSLLYRQGEDMRKYPFTYLLPLVIIVHSELIDLVFTKFTGLSFERIFHEGVANQYILGHVLQPSMFGVFLLLSIALFLREKYYTSVIAASIAVNFHITYLLSYTFLILAYLVILIREKKNLGALSTYMLVAGMLALPSLLYSVLFFSSESAEFAEQANKILFEQRIPHHALISVWFNLETVINIVIVAFALYLLRKKRMFLIIAIPFAAATLLTFASVFIKHPHFIKLFPWRISAMITPICTFVILDCLLNFLYEKIQFIRQFKEKYVKLLLWIAVLAFACGGIWVMRYHSQLYHIQVTNDLFQYVDAMKAEDETYLVPLDQEDFRLMTGAPIFVDFKSHPYKDTELLEWYHRIELARKLYANDEESVDAFEEICENYSITNFVWPKENGRERFSNLQIVYESNLYLVYIVPQNKLSFNNSSIEDKLWTRLKD